VVALQSRTLIGAGVGRRAAAVIVDLLVMSPVLFVVFRAFGHSTTNVTSAGTAHTYFLGLPGLVVTAVVVVAYHTVLEGLFGWTVGKRVTGLVVLGEDGSPIDIRSALKRNLLRVVDGLFLYLVAAVAVWASPTHQRFGDRAAHTIVVHGSSQPAVVTTPLPPPPNAYWGNR
jgi:uncharacterized RDD family membrane protein YckC